MAKKKKKARNLSDKIASDITSALIQLRSMDAQVRRRVIPTLRLLEEELTEQLVNAGLDHDKPSVKQQRAEKLLQDIRSIIKDAYSTARRQANSILRPLASIANETSVSILNKAFTFDIVKVTLTSEEIRALVDNQIVLGTPLKEWWSNQAEKVRQNYSREVRLGVLSGETNQQMIARIRGKPTGKSMLVDLPNGKQRRVREFAEGVLQVNRNEAETLIRTSTNSVSNAAMFDVYENNTDLIKGYFAITTLDGRTSIICIARTGAAWDTDGNPLPESTRKERFPGPTPWHPNCRTTLGPLTKTWEELAEEATGVRAKLMETVPDSVRASADGLIPNNVHGFDDWLEDRGEADARAQLGPARYDLWKAGKLTTPQLLDNRGNVLSIAQLRASLGLKPE